MPDLKSLRKVIEILSGDIFIFGIPDTLCCNSALLQILFIEPFVDIGAYVTIGVERFNSDLCVLFHRFEIVYHIRQDLNIRRQSENHSSHYHRECKKLRTQLTSGFSQTFQMQPDISDKYPQQQNRYHGYAQTCQNERYHFLRPYTAYYKCILVGGHITYGCVIK